VNNNLHKVNATKLSTDAMLSLDRREVDERLGGLNVDQSYRVTKVLRPVGHPCGKIQDWPKAGRTDKKLLGTCSVSDMPECVLEGGSSGEPCALVQALAQARVWARAR
jgi:hypothetical protein